MCSPTQRRSHRPSWHRGAAGSHTSRVIQLCTSDVHVSPAHDQSAWMLTHSPHVRMRTRYLTSPFPPRPRWQRVLRWRSPLRFLQRWQRPRVQGLLVRPAACQVRQEPRAGCAPSSHTGGAHPEPSPVTHAATAWAAATSCSSRASYIAPPRPTSPPIAPHRSTLLQTVAPHCSRPSLRVAPRRSASLRIAPRGRERVRAPLTPRAPATCPAKQRPGCAR